ncbi:tetratricopeptide repeat protein, partial [bacterium]|nr:tetratricopeptide repeat protein [bacterium]
SGCGGEGPDERRGNLFFKNGKYYEAFQAYEKAVAKDAKLLESQEFAEKFKNAYYYYGGALEMSGSLDSAVKYYILGFNLVPTEVGICDKLAKYFWEKEEFAEGVKYFKRLVELDAESPDTDKKWAVMGEDYYALGYSLFKIKMYTEAIEALKQSLKVAPQGAFAKKAKNALAAAQAALKK